MFKYKKNNFKWLLLFVGFALNAQEQKTTALTRNEISYNETESDLVKLNNNSLFELNEIDELVFYVKSTQITQRYRENEGLINSGIVRFVKIEFAGKKIKGLKDINSRTVV